MIVPWLKGFVNWTEAPLTWSLIGINFLLFLMTLEPVKNNREILLKAESLSTVGQMYRQYLGNNNVLSDNEAYVLGTQALKDWKFLISLDAAKFSGDQILVSETKSALVSFRDKSGSKNHKLFGLSQHEFKWLTLVTYQFMHAGWIHLFGNMLMLLIFAGAAELRTKSGLVLFVYLLGGVGGALGFVFNGELNFAPMIGASASLSSVMAFYALCEKKKRVNFFFFFSPFQGHFGWVHLPTWLIFPIGFAGDLASFLSSAPEFRSSVAYTAHLGGALTGVAIALVIKWLRLEQNLYASYSQKYSEAP